MNTPRIAFLDVDGTIIDENRRIAPSTIDAIQTARLNGHLVYLCTGRATVEIFPFLREIGFDGTISAGGGFAAVGDRLVISRTMPADSLARMVDFYDSSGYDYYLQAYDALYPNVGAREEFAAREQREELALAGSGAPRAPRRFTDEEPHPAAGIGKSVFMAADIAAFDRVHDALNDEFHVITGTIPHLGRGSGEVTLKGVNKGTTITQLLDVLGLDASSALGIGDNSNDVEMLQLCGVGVAMGNATDEIKSHADQVTTSVLDDGIWNAFRRNNLI